MRSFLSMEGLPSLSADPDHDTHGQEGQGDQNHGDDEDDEGGKAVHLQGFGLEGHFRLTFCVDESIIANSADSFKNAMKNL